MTAGGVARGWDPEFESALLQGRVVCEPACWRSWTRRGRVRSRSPTPTAERWRRIHSGLSASPFHARPAPSPTLSLGHEDGEHRRESIGAGVEARLTAMIARWTLSSISGQSELWTTLTPFPRIRIVRRGCAPPCTIRENSNGPISLSVNLGASAPASSHMAGGSSAEHFSSLGALAERQRLSRRSKRDWDATIRPRRRCRHADCTQTGGGNPRRRITISRLLRGAP